MVSDANAVWPPIWIMRQVDFFGMARAGKSGGAAPQCFVSENQLFVAPLAFHVLDFGYGVSSAHDTKHYLFRLLAIMLATFCISLPPLLKIGKHCARSMLLYWCMSFPIILQRRVGVVLVVLNGGAIFHFCYSFLLGFISPPI